jgi:type IV secretion system protein VirD4
MSSIVKANFHTIDMILSDKTRSVKELWTAMKEHSNPIVSAAGQDMLDRPDEEAGSVLSTVKSNLSLFRDPIVAKNVESSDFSVRDLMHHESPVSLYLISQPSDKGRIRPMLRIFVCMCMRLLADKMEFKNGRAVKTYKHRLLMMLDEFPALGKMDIVQESLAFVAGYGIKCYLITQDLGQLYSAYGKDESITSNCHIQNCFPAIKDDTCAYISKMTGTTTIVKETKSKSGSGLKTNITRGIQEVKRELLTPGEVKSLPGSVKDSKGMILEAGKMLIFAAGFPPIFGQQPLYFKDPIFSKRSAVPEAKKSDILR